MLPFAPMSAAEILRIGHAAYVASEESAPQKREYWDGFLVAMAGGSVRHSALGARVVSELGRALEGGACREFNSDLRIRVEALNASFYPDASVICGNVATSSDDAHAATNPTLVVEVVSPSTETYDRGAKFHAYSRLASLKAYLLVDSTTGSVDLFERDADPDRWMQTTVAGTSGGSLAIGSLGITLSLDRVFAGFAELP